MKVLAFPDLHRHAKIAEELMRLSDGADVLVGAGDFATQGFGAAETLEVLARSAVPVILVHGNHDDPAEISEFCSKHDQLHYLHGSAATVNDITFFGVGGEIPPRNNHAWNAFETEDGAAALLSTCPSGAVLITHTPPFGVADQQRTGEHEGSIAIRDAVQWINPPLHLCGHIHYAWGTTGQISSTHVHNLSPTANWFGL